MDAERRPRALDAAVAALATRQHGVVARRQLVEVGLGRGAIARRLEAGRLHELHRGVYAVGHRMLTREARWMAATLVAEDAVLSHRAAAGLWRIWRGDPGRIEVTLPRSVRARRGGGAIGRNVTKHELELRFLAFLDAHGLPRPRVNAKVELRPRPREGRLPVARPAPCRRARRVRHAWTWRSRMTA